MRIFDHGVFSPYNPTSPGDAPATAFFTRNAQGEDWYQFCASAPSDRTAWALLSADGVVLTAAKHADALSPSAMRVISVEGLEPGAIKGKRFDGAGFVVAPLPVPAIITRRQCAIELHARALISDAETLAMVTAGTPPAVVDALIAQMPAADRLRAQIDFAADKYERTNPLLSALMAAQGASASDIDAFFRAAAAR